MSTLSPTPVSPSRARARWRSADHEQRRNLIVDVAMDLLARKGIGSVTMRVVAKRLGVGAMTLYTYVDGQDELRRQMIRRGFDMLCNSCEHDADSHQVDPNAFDWRPGARAYVRFALGNPNVYRLMFADPGNAGAVNQVMTDDEGFGELVERVASILRESNPGAKGIEDKARAAAGRYWIALHGLASLAIDDRLEVLGTDVFDLLDHMLECVAPT